MQNFINLGKDEKQQADLFRETEASTMYPPEKNSKTSKSTLLPVLCNKVLWLTPERTQTGERFIL